MFVIFMYSSNIFHREVQLNYNESHVGHAIMETIKFDTETTTEVGVAINVLVLEGSVISCICRTGGNHTGSPTCTASCLHYCLHCHVWLGQCTVLKGRVRFASVCPKFLPGLLALGTVHGKAEGQA